MTENNVRTYRCKICNRLFFTTEKWGGDVCLYRKLPKQPVVKILAKNNYYVKFTYIRQPYHPPITKNGS